jgi:hypothetical protein
MSGFAYEVFTENGGWYRLLTDTRSFCLGYYYGVREDAALGVGAGLPTPEQYEAAAERALAKAQYLRERASR